MMLGSQCSPCCGPPTAGACCNGTQCRVVQQGDCDTAAGEVFKGVGTVCDPNPCAICSCSPDFPLPSAFRMSWSGIDYEPAPRLPPLQGPPLGSADVAGQLSEALSSLSRVVPLQPELSQAGLVAFYKSETFNDQQFAQARFEISLLCSDGAIFPSWLVTYYSEADLFTLPFAGPFGSVWNPVTKVHFCQSIGTVQLLPPVNLAFQNNSFYGQALGHDYLSLSGELILEAIYGNPLP